MMCLKHKSGKAHRASQISVFFADVLQHSISSPLSWKKVQGIIMK